MSTWRQRWQSAGSQLRRPWLALGLALAAVAAYFGQSYYRAHHELTEIREHIANLELPEAKTRLEAYLEAWPKDGEAQVLLARTHRMMGHFPTASAYLRQAESAAASPSEITLEKLLLEVEQTGELSAATSVLQQYLDGNAPEAPMAFQALATGALRVRRLDLADYWLHLWVDRLPDDWRGHFFLGGIYRNRGIWHEAVREFEQALALRPSYAEAQHWLGVCLVRSGHDHGKAIQHLESYLERKPTSATALSALAQAQFSLGQRDAAAATVNRLLEQDDRHTWALLILAQIQLEDGEGEKALATLGRINARKKSADPRERGMLLSLQAKTLRYLGRTLEAETYERQFRVLNDDLQQLATALGNITNPADQLNLRRQVGLLYLRLGYFDEAQQWLEAVRRARPDDKIVQQALDECQRKVSEAESPEGSR